MSRNGARTLGRASAKALRGRAGVATAAIVAVALFALALNGGTYGLTSRNAVAISLWWAIGLSAVLGVRPLARVPRAGIATGLVLGGFAALMAASALWADSSENAFSEWGRVALYLGVLVVTLVAVPRRYGSRVVDGLALGMAAVGVLAFLDRCFPHVIDHGTIGSEFAGDARATWPLNYWNGLAIFVGLAFPGLLRIAVDGRTALARAAALGAFPALAGTIYLTSSRGGSAAAVVGLLAFVALAGRRVAATLAALVGSLGSAAAVALLSTQDELVNGPLGRGAALSQGRVAVALVLLVCLGTGLTWLAVARLERPLPAIGRRGKLALAALAGVILVVGIAAAHPGRRFDDFKQPPPVSGEARTSVYTGNHLLSSGSAGRWQAWGGALDEFASRPVAGRGAGSYEAWWEKHADVTYVTRYAHSLYLQTLGELGVVGFTLLLGMFGTVAVAAAGRWRRSRAAERGTLAAAIGIFVAWAVAAGIDWTWELPAVAIVGIVLLGLLTGPATLGSADEPDRVEPTRRRSRNFALRVGVAAISVAIIVGLAIPLLARVNIQDSQRAAARGDISSAAAEARTARDFQPWAASPYQQLALVQEQAGRLRDAQRSLADALERDPGSWRLWLLRARVEQEAGHPFATRAAFNRALELNPRSPLLNSLQRQTGTRGASP
jgi:hypothetical protein